MIVGTLPPPRFSTKQLKAGDVDFCYGSKNGLLWPVLDRIFGLKLRYETTKEAVQQRKDFLSHRGIGVCDIVARCKRTKVDASDLGMHQPVLRDVVGYLRQYPAIDTLIFTGGNSKNGPEYFFRQHLKIYGLSLDLVSNSIPRIHQFALTPSKVTKATASSPRILKTVSLTAPSGAANRAIGSMQAYKSLKDANPEFTTLDFRVLQYKRFF